MKQRTNEIYTLVDENFLSQFPSIQRKTLEDMYYSIYLKVCESRKKKPLNRDIFFTNMRRRRLRFFQLCCPYCGATGVMLHDNRISHSEGYNYCSSCGKGSTESIINDQLARFTRIRFINSIGIAAYASMRPDSDIRLIGYDGYQMEIIELASIVEVILRDCFVALFNMSFYGAREAFVTKLLNRYIGNDFLLIEKATDHYKKALGIDLKAIIPTEIWNDLVDVTNMRNMMIHNNGMIDSQFRKSKSYERLKDKVDGPLLLIDQDMIDSYYNSVSHASTIVMEVFQKKYHELKKSMIAMHYYTTNSTVNNEG